MENHSPEQNEHLKSLKYSGEHLLGVINNLIDFNKIESGNVQLANKNFNLNYVLESIKSLFYSRAENKGVVFSIVKHNAIPNSIMGDSLKLTQILNNLLNNSLNFTKNGSIVLHVKCLGVKDNKHELKFKIIDTGISNVQQKRNIVFEDFVNDKEAFATVTKGYGLGLSISKKLLQILDSDLIIKIKTGKGASFKFTLLFDVSSKSNSSIDEIIKIQATYLPLNINILVAEDNKMNVLMLKPFFTKWNITYKVAENGEEVLKYFDQEKFNFDLVLMDIHMPILDGFKATRIIRNLSNSQKANIPIIAFTAFAQTDVKEKTQRYGMNAFISKPFNPLKLYKILKAYTKSELQRGVG